MHGEEDVALFCVTEYENCCSNSVTQEEDVALFCMTEYENCCSNSVTQEEDVALFCMTEYENCCSNSVTHGSTVGVSSIQYILTVPEQEEQLVWFNRRDDSHLHVHLSTLVL